MRKRALFDLDGTLADYDSAQPYRRAEPGWWQALPPLRFGIELLKAAQHLGFECHVVTKGPASISHAWGEKLRWCQKHVPGVPVTVTQDKAIVAGDLLVDDSLEVIESWMAANPEGTVICVPQPYNEGFRPAPNLHRVDNVEQAIAILREFPQREKNPTLPMMCWRTEQYAKYHFYQQHFGDALEEVSNDFGVLAGRATEQSDEPELTKEGLVAPACRDWSDRRTTLHIDWYDVIVLLLGKEHAQLSFFVREGLQRRAFVAYGMNRRPMRRGEPIYCLPAADQLELLTKLWRWYQEAFVRGWIRVTLRQAQTALLLDGHGPADKRHLWMELNKRMRTGLRELAAHGLLSTDAADDSSPPKAAERALQVWRQLGGQGRVRKPFRGPRKVS